MMPPLNSSQLVRCLLCLLLAILYCQSGCHGQRQRFREDGKCGQRNLAADGFPAECDYIAPFPTCCQRNGHCGWDCDDAPAVEASGGPPRPQPPPAPTAAPPPQFESTGRYRSDGRCGAANPLEDGTPAECDPNSQYWCCSEHGYCGGTQEHCYCDTCVNYRPVDLVGRVRTDRRCGKEFPLPDGSASECDGNSANHCCSKWGYCGPGADHCDCVGCVDFRSVDPKEKLLVDGRVRADRRCGVGEFALPDGSPSECNPQGPNPCCSKWGYCGPDADHCSCDGCVDYRSSDQKLSDFIANGRVRRDRRCGGEFPLPDGKTPSECDPDSANFCCSKWGYCGGDGEHCDCPTCVNYKKLLVENEKPLYEYDYY